MLLGVAVMAMAAGPARLEAVGRDIALVVSKAGGEYVEELLVGPKSGGHRTVLVSPTHPLLRESGTPQPNALQGFSGGLFSAPPTMAFQTAALAKRKSGTDITLVHESSEIKITKTVSVPQTGRLVNVKLVAEFKTAAPRISSMLASYAFVPDGKRLSKGGKPDTTFSPAIRPGPMNVVGDHFFRAPVVVAQKGSLAASLLPDLDTLAEHRPMPTIIDLDCKNGVVDAPLLSYGFADYRPAGHVYFNHDASMSRSVPRRLEVAFDLLLNGDAPARGGYQEAARYLWARYGHANFEKVLPQAMPFEDYARVCYPAAFNETYGDNKIGWFEQEIDGRICGGVAAGWGFQQGWVSWQSWFNNLRSAWGLRWWGKRLGEKDWVDKADKMLNLALAAPMKDGAVPTTYMSRERQWKGSLIMPTPDCYYDLTNMAWKGIWMLRWLEFPDSPRRSEILEQCRAMADLMVRVQNKDGSIPTWLDKDLKVVPILDHSAQSALPAWFLAEMALIDKTNRINWTNAVLRAADFLAKNVVDQQRYYDFETFFSCSPKTCLQVKGVIDDEAMHDPHTLSPPQNTLAMQWTAEALMAAQRLHPNSKPQTPNSLKALDIMALYQNVWSLPYRKAAYTFGGFGVQNSDGEYLDARQAQFGATLADFGAMLGRQDYFERGVAATRAAMTLINHPLHEKLGLYPNPNYPLGLQPENTGHGGADEQNGRTGFDWGEGSGLASMAWLLHKYGGAYVDDQKKWAVGIDNVTVGKSGRLFDHKRSEITIEDSRRIEVKSRSGKIESVVATPFPFAFDASLYGRTSSQFSQPDLNDIGIAVQFYGLGLGDFEGNFVSGDGSKARAENHAWSEQSGFRIGSTVAAKFPPTWSGKSIRLKGKWQGMPVEFGPWRLYLDPTFDFTDVSDWSVHGDFADLPTNSTRMDFGLSKGEMFVGTCENGRGGYDDAYTGTIESPLFLITKPTIKLLVGGGAGKGVYVELLDAEGKQIAVARGKNRERTDEVVWDVAAHKGKMLRIRIVDKETAGWGHINVARIRAVQ